MNWHPILAIELGEVKRIADAVHLKYPEDALVFEERQCLYPEGCHILVESGKSLGYVISHPWHFKNPPTLNVLLGAIPAKPTTYYLHDLALLPVACGLGNAMAIVKQIREFATTAGFLNMSLVAVNNSQTFWEKMGFQIFDDRVLIPKLHTYGSDAKFMVCHCGAYDGTRDPRPCPQILP